MSSGPGDPDESVQREITNSDNVFDQEHRDSLYIPLRMRSSTPLFNWYIQGCRKVLESFKRTNEVHNDTVHILTIQLNPFLWGGGVQQVIKADGFGLSEV